MRGRPSEKGHPSKKQSPYLVTLAIDRRMLVSNRTRRSSPNCPRRIKADELVKADRPTVPPALTDALARQPGEERQIGSRRRIRSASSSVALSGSKPNS